MRLGNRKQMRLWCLRKMELLEPQLSRQTSSRALTPPTRQPRRSTGLASPLQNKLTQTDVSRAIKEWGLPASSVAAITSSVQAIATRTSITALSTIRPWDASRWRRRILRSLQREDGQGENLPALSARSHSNVADLSRLMN